MRADNVPMYALLVGINDYANLTMMPPLGGCVNDVTAMAHLLRDKFDVPDDHIRVLTNQQATHASIVAAFQEHLLASARAWAQAGKPGAPPAFLFHYSGHGSQAIDETGREPDGFDETIVPYDSRTPGVYDIKDWELGQWLDELARYSDNITVILDSCHSGSGTRDIKPTVLPTRRCPPDLRPQPTSTSFSNAGMRSLAGPSGWTVAARHVLLAACRDHEEANEYVDWDSDDAPQHGALTYFLIQELARLSPDRPLLYRELHERIRYVINAEYPHQMPQCEGDRDRLVFGGLRPARDVFLSVLDLDPDSGLIWVDGGAVHNLSAGSLLRVYSPETRTLAEAGPPLATLSVEQTQAARCACLVVEGAAAIPLHARAVIYRLHHGAMQRPVTLDVADPALLVALQTHLTAEDAAPYVKLAPPGAPAEFRVQAIDERLEIQNSIGQRLVAPFRTADFDGLAQDLTHLVRYHNALHLRNTAPDSALVGAVHLAVKRLDFDPHTQAPVARPFETPPIADLQVAVGEKIVLETTNRATQPLYVALFDFSYDWSVTLLYPRVRGAHEALAPGKTLALGLSRERKGQIAPQLPPEMTTAPQWLKVIATVAEADFEILQQPALKSPFATRAIPRSDSALTRLMGQAIYGTRAVTATVEDAWTTTELKFQLVRPIM